MATVATQLNSGSGFASGEVVTATKLNNLVNTATVTGILTADISDAQITTAKIADGAITQAKLNAAVTLVPAGAVMPFAMNTAPTGWLAADGTNVSRATYAALFAAIGTTYGSGDGSTTFALPDLRGYFVRGSGTNSDGTAAGTFGAKQTDALKTHTHTYSQYTANIGNYREAGGNGPGLNGASSNVNTGDPSTGTSTETRPKNIAMLYCIKF